MTNDPSSGDLRAAFIEVAKMGVLAEHFQRSLEENKNEIRALKEENKNDIKALRLSYDQISIELSKIRLDISQLAANEQLREAQERLRTAPGEMQSRMIWQALAAIGLLLVGAFISTIADGFKGQSQHPTTIQRSPQSESRR